MILLQRWLSRIEKQTAQN